MSCRLLTALNHSLSTPLTHRAPFSRLLNDPQVGVNSPRSFGDICCWWTVAYLALEEKDFDSDQLESAEFIQVAYGKVGIYSSSTLFIVAHHSGANSLARIEKHRDLDLKAITYFESKFREYSHSQNATAN